MVFKPGMFNKGTFEAMLALEHGTRTSYLSRAVVSRACSIYRARIPLYRAMFLLTETATNLNFFREYVRAGCGLSAGRPWDVFC